ncbi:MAG: cell envelope integrity protein TolA [Chlorobaculum sp.]|nr:cell envelope integrity protein TolA [Chlorobaculum sp.]
MQGRNELKQELRRFYTWLWLAAAAHVALIAAVVALQLLYVRMHPPMKIVNVSLVQMPGLPGPAGGPKSVEAPPAAEMPPEKAEAPAVTKVSEPPPQPVKKIPEPVAVKKIPEKIPLKAPEPTPKKESAADEQKRLQAALDQLRKKTAAQQSPANTATGPTNLSSTLANLQKKVASQGAGTAYSGSGSGAGGGRYGSGGSAFDPYKAKIAGIIQGNWTFSKQMVRSTTGMEVYVSLLIMPDGTVSQIRYDKQSPSEYLNSSVRSALKKSTPFPALPREYGTKGVWVGFVFTPEGIGR